MMVDEDFGMPDTPWIDDSDEWGHCQYNPAGGELVVGQAVRLNLIDPSPFNDPPIGQIVRIASWHGRRYAMVRWPDGEKPVPRCFLVKV